MLLNLWIRNVHDFLQVGVECVLQWHIEKKSIIILDITRGLGVFSNLAFRKLNIFCRDA